MGKVKFTKDQQKVIDLRNCNVLVAAAAGSGKTAVLVERILKKISSREKPVDIDRLLVVTFTDAAAGEMRERISRAIEERRILEPNNAHLERQAALIHNAQITTIHSFCLGIIRNYFNEVDLDPGFRLGDETEVKLLKAEVMEAVLEAFYAEGGKEFTAFVESYAAGKRDEGLEKLIYRLYDFAMSYPWPKQWLESQRACFLLKSLEDFYAAPWQSELLGFLKAEIMDCMEENRIALELTREIDGPYMYEAALEADRELLLLLAKAKSYQEIGDILSELSWAKLSAKRDANVDAEKREVAKLLRDSVKKTVNGLREKYYFQPPEEMLADMQGAAPAMNALVDATLAFMEAYQRKKEDRNLLDFNDLEHYALKILVEEPKEGSLQPVPTRTAVELSHFYDEILIDEYQDSNLVQETLLNSISKEKFGKPNVFMVGDVKQSIYKFRLARPELFMGKFETYQEEGSYVRVDLKQNFRSRNSVLQAINYIFYGIMKKDLGNIRYDEAAALYPGREEKENEKEDVSEEMGAWDEWEQCELLIAESSKEVPDKELEGKIIAKRMRELHEEQGIPYKDMVILLRSMKGWSEELAAVLKEEGIPARAATRTGYFSAVEVITVLNLLLVIDNPRQDIPLAAVLRSYIGGFDDEELAQMRCLDKEGELYDCLLLERSEKANRFLALLRKLRRLVPLLGIYELLTVIYETTGYYRYVKALPGGAARCANLDMLLEKGADFEKTSYGGLFQFNRYIEKLHRYEVDFGEAEAVLGSQDTVSIMSIHKSKGLEFPVVFLAGMGKGFNKQDARERILFHPDLGIGPDYIDSSLRTKAPTLLKQAIKRKTDLENLGEELRILYVAMTRAREKLILTGCVKEHEKARIKWQQGKPLLFSQRAAAGSYLDWIMPRVFAWQEGPKVSGASYVITYVTEAELAFETVFSRIAGEGRKERLLSLELETEDIWSEEEKAKVEACLTFQYPYENEGQIKSKLTVSELKRLSQQEEDGSQMLKELEEKEAYVPDFAREEVEASGSLRGTVYHRVMEHISFLRAEAKGLESELQRLEAAGKISKEERKMVSLRKLSKFLKSSLGLRMKEAENAGLLYRERPFVIGLPAKSVQPELESEETVLVQGVIDCFFEEAEGLVLVDYKTDRVSEALELAQRYKSQLEYYKAALEQLTGKRVKECYIYSFSLGEMVELPQTEFYKEY